MFMSAQAYLQRISHALEHEVAPKVECDHLRGQILAAVFLLDQLSDRIDYKPEILRQEAEAACGLLRRILEALRAAGGEPPAEWERFGAAPQTDSAADLLGFRDSCNEALSRAIDLFFSSRDGLAAEDASQIEGLILEHALQVASRDLSMMKPSTSMKILQKKGQPELR